MSRCPNFWYYMTVCPHVMLHKPFWDLTFAIFFPTNVCVHECMCGCVHVQIMCVYYSLHKPFCESCFSVLPWYSKPIAVLSTRSACTPYFPPNPVEQSAHQSKGRGQRSRKKQGQVAAVMNAQSKINPQSIPSRHFMYSRSGVKFRIRVFNRIGVSNMGKAYQRARWSCRHLAYTYVVILDQVSQAVGGRGSFGIEHIALSTKGG